MAPVTIRVLFAVLVNSGPRRHEIEGKVAGPPPRSVSGAASWPGCRHRWSSGVDVEPPDVDASLNGLSHRANPKSWGAPSFGLTVTAFHRWKLAGRRSGWDEP